MAQAEVARGGLPFAAIVVNQRGEIISRGLNTVAISEDPTDHAEIRALRAASKKLKSSELTNHNVYVIGHPCEMCMAALKLAKPKKIIFALSLEEKNQFFKPIKTAPPIEQVLENKKQALKVFEQWAQSSSLKLKGSIIN